MPPSGERNVAPGQVDPIPDPVVFDPNILQTIIDLWEVQNKCELEILLLLNFDENDRPRRDVHGNLKPYVPLEFIRQVIQAHN